MERKIINSVHEGKSVKPNETSLKKIVLKLHTQSYCTKSCNIKFKKFTTKNYQFQQQQ